MAITPFATPNVNIHNADSTTGRKPAADAATIALSNEDKASLDSISSSISGVATETTLSAILTDTNKFTFLSTRLLVDNSGVTQPISAASLPLPSGAATETTLAAIKTDTDKFTFTSTRLLVDGSGVTQPVSGTITANAGTGNFTVVQATGTNLHAVLDSGTVTANVGTTGGLALDATLTGGTQKTKLVDTGGVNVASISAAGAVKIDGSGVTQPVSGTITANIGTSGSLALEATQVKMTIAQGTALGSNTQVLSGASVSTAAPTYTDGQISPLSLTTAGALRVDTGSSSFSGNITQWGSTATTLGQKASTASVPTVLASDYIPLPSSDYTASGTITALNGSVSITVHAAASALFTLTGTWVATLQIQGLAPDGATWLNLTNALTPSGNTFSSGTTSANGTYRILTASSYTQLRITATAFTSGTVSVSIVASEAVSTQSVINLNSANMQVTSNPVDGGRTTYTATVTALSTAATATDIFTITGSATKTIRITQLMVSGIATGGSNIDLLVIKRSTANSGGTSTTPTVTPYDSADAAGTAVVRAYTANPTLGTTVSTILVQKLPVPLSGTQFYTNPIIFQANRPARAIVLRGTSEVVAVNLNSVTLAGSSFNLSVEWTEE